MGNYTKISNQLLEILMSDLLTPGETKIMLCVLRKTNGFQKTWDKISLTQFEKATGLSRKSVVVLLGTLVTRRLLLKRNRNRNVACSWAIPEDINLEKVVTPSLLVTRSSTPTVNIQKHTKEKLARNISDSSVLEKPHTYKKEELPPKVWEEAKRRVDLRIEKGEKIARPESLILKIGFEDVLPNYKPDWRDNAKQL